MTVEISNQDLSDLLICGSCRRDFPLANIVNFVDHKKFNCSEFDLVRDLLGCQSCPSTFNTPWSLLQHAQTVHELKIYHEQRGEKALQDAALPRTLQDTSLPRTLQDTSLTEPFKLLKQGWSLAKENLSSSDSAPVARTRLSALQPGLRPVLQPELQPGLQPGLESGLQPGLQSARENVPMPTADRISSSAGTVTQNLRSNQIVSDMLLTTSKQSVSTTNLMKTSNTAEPMNKRGEGRALERGGEMDEGGELENVEDVGGVSFRNNLFTFQNQLCKTVESSAVNNDSVFNTRSTALLKNGAEAIQGHTRDISDVQTRSNLTRSSDATQLGSTVRSNLTRSSDATQLGSTVRPNLTRSSDMTQLGSTVISYTGHKETVSDTDAPVITTSFNTLQSNLSKSSTAVVRASEPPKPLSTIVSDSAHRATDTRLCTVQDTEQHDVTDTLLDERSSSYFETLHAGDWADSSSSATTALSSWATAASIVTSNSWVTAATVSSSWAAAPSSWTTAMSSSSISKVVTEDGKVKVEEGEGGGMKPDTCEGVDTGLDDISDVTVDAIAAEITEKVRCTDRSCGSEPHTHSRLKRCCSSVVPKKRKHHIETKHRLALSSLGPRYSSILSRYISGGLGPGARCARRRVSGGEDGHTNIYIDVDDECNVTVGPETRENSNDSNSSSYRKQRSVIIEPGMTLSIPVSYNSNRSFDSLDSQQLKQAAASSSGSTAADESWLLPSGQAYMKPGHLTGAQRPMRGLETLLVGEQGEGGGELMMGGVEWEGVSPRGGGSDGGQNKRRKYPTSRPFKCDECSDAFNQRIHLRKHQSKHTGVKPFKCDRCDYSTVERSHLKVHIRVHTGEKPYKCTVCEYATAQNSTLKIHLKRRHHLDSPATASALTAAFNSAAASAAASCLTAGLSAAASATGLSAAASSAGLIGASVPGLSASSISPAVGLSAASAAGAGRLAAADNDSSCDSADQ